MADLPSLNALRAFDAAARHGNLTRAAEELHVTHGAVSRQVKELEAFLGRPMFQRQPRGLTLTPHGTQLAAAVAGAFQELRRGVAEARAHTGNQLINVHTVPSLAGRWLVPRMARYQAEHQGVEIRVATGYLLTDFSRDDVDLALRYGRGPWPGLHSEPLFGTEVSPVCAPALLEGERPLRKPADLAGTTLLHDMTHDYWARWLEAAGVTAVDPRAGLVLEDFNVLLQAVIEGQGVALAPESLVSFDLRAGRLVRPFQLAIPIDIGFHIVCQPHRLDDPVLAPFIEWLREEARATGSDP